MPGAFCVQLVRATFSCFPKPSCQVSVCAPGAARLPRGPVIKAKVPVSPLPMCLGSGGQGRAGKSCVPAPQLAVAALPGLRWQNNGDALLNSRAMPIPAPRSLLWKPAHQIRASPRVLSNPGLFLLWGHGAALLPDSAPFAQLLKAPCSI